MKGKAVTVLGPICPEELGITTPHEHLQIDMNSWFEEPEEASQKIHSYEPVRLDNLSWVKQNLFNNRDNFLLLDAVESTREIMEFKRFGGNTIVDVTNIGIERDPVALKKISIETGINIIMDSG